MEEMKNQSIAQKGYGVVGIHCDVTTEKIVAIKNMMAETITIVKESDEIAKSAVLSLCGILADLLLISPTEIDAIISSHKSASAFSEYFLNSNKEKSTDDQLFG